MATTDAQVRRGVSDLPAFDFGSTPVTRAPDLRSARVAIVTTAGLRDDGVGTWNDGQGFTILDSARRDLTVAHISPNFDRGGVAVDLNVVYPIDRLNELANSGAIGSVATSHISFMGAQLDHTLTTAVTCYAAPKSISVHPERHARCGSLAPTGQELPRE